MKRLACIAPVVLVLSFAAPSHATVNSLFTNGVTFFDTGGFDRTAEDLGADDLSPGYDGDYLLTFRDSKRTSVLAGFGIFWSRRTDKRRDVPFQEASAKGRIETIGLPFTLGFGRRDPENAGRGWFWGLLAHYYFLKVSVDAPPGQEPSYFRVSGDEGERNAQGPALSAFVAYEVPFFLGRIGAGAKGRVAKVTVSDEPGLATPAIDLTGVTFFLSVALR